MAESTGRTALAAAVGLVLADSSVVVLALPEIYRELDVSVTAVTWVLIAFNLVLALAAVPAAHAAGALGPARLTAAGLVLFARRQPGLRPGAEHRGSCWRPAASRRSAARRRSAPRSSCCRRLRLRASCGAAWAAAGATGARSAPASAAC